MTEDNTMAGSTPPDGPGQGGPSDHASLRRDIADELTDHLVLSAKAEQLSGANEPTSQQAALDHFGNPDMLAKRLYFDAIKGRIIRQNIRSGALVVLTVAGVGLGVSAFLTIRTGQADMLGAMQANRDALVEGLAALQPAPAEPRVAQAPGSAEWRKVRVELVDRDGRLIATEGYRCSITGALIDRGEETTLSEGYPAESPLTFGPVRVGKHEVKVYTPRGIAKTHVRTTVLPGRDDHVIRVTCPNPGDFLPRPEVTLNVPEDLALVGLSALIKIDPHSVKRYGERYWENRELYYLVDMSGNKPAKPALGGGCDTSDGSVVMTDPNTSQRTEWTYDRIGLQTGDTALLPIVSCFPERFIVYWDVNGLLKLLGGGEHHVRHRIATLEHAQLNDALQGSSLTAQFDPASNIVSVEGSDGFWDAVRGGIDPDIMTQVRERHDAAKVASDG
ncbi:MAG: hypothetical protein AAGI37_16330 [Planctomycetota bacterium]